MSKRGPEGVRASLRNKADKAFDWVGLSKNLLRSSLCCFFVSIKVSVQVPHRPPVFSSYLMPSDFH